jgi:CPA2 family monovalent cation:H+ antiporter-2
MEDTSFLFEIVVLLASAIVAVVLFQRLRISPILGYLACGILIGPGAFELVTNVETIKGVGALGVVILLFSIGLELSFKRLAVLRLEVFGLGTAQVVACALILGGAALAFGVSVKAAFVIGTGLALSSTAVVLQLMSERREIASRTGRVAFAVLLLQDLAAVPLLAVVPIMGAAAKALDWAAVGLAVGKAVVALAVIIVVGRLVLQPVYRTVSRDHGAEIFVALTLLAVLGTGWATASVGLSLTLGAFLAGLLLAETEFRHQIEADIQPFRGLLMGLFFMSIGMQIDPHFALRNAAFLIALVAALIAIKAAVTTGLALAIRLPPQIAVRVGLILGQGGEFGFILVGGAAAIGLVPEPAKQVVLSVVALSMMLTPLLAMLGAWLGKRLHRVTRIGLAALEHETHDITRHVVIVGFGRVGRIIARILESRRIPYVALDHDPANVSDAREHGLPIYFGHVERRDILWGLGIDRARALVITMDAPRTTLGLVSVMKQRLPEVTIVARARDTAHAKELLDAGAHVAVPETLEASLVLGGAALRLFELGENEIATTLNEMRADRGFLLEADRPLWGAYTVEGREGARAGDGASKTDAGGSGTARPDAAPPEAPNPDRVTSEPARTGR